MIIFWKAGFPDKVNFPNNLKKDYVPFEESNLKHFNNAISVNVPPEIK